MREVPVVDLRAAKRVRSVLLVREPGRLGDVAGEETEERQHHRPADPVAERRNGPDERRVLAPGLVRVDRHPARLVREHGGELRVDDLDGKDDGRRDPPDHRGAPAAEVDHRESERSEQEARVREADHESVVPAERLQELALLDDCLSHDSSSSSAIPAPSRQYEGRAAERNTWRGQFQRRGNRSGERGVQSVRVAQATDHDQV